MSTDAHVNHAHNEHAHDDHAHDEAAPHGTLQGYLTGFILAVILSAIPFWLVMGKVIQDLGIVAE